MVSRLVPTLLCTVLLWTGATAACAQFAPQFGVTLGLNRATIESADADPGSRWLFAGGAVARQPLVGPLAAQAELLLNQKGASISGEEGTIRYGASYVDLPLQLRAEAPSLGAVTLSGTAGGYGAVKVFERQRAGEDLSFPLRTSTSFFRRIDAGWMAGVGATIDLNTRRLNLTVRYAHGLTDVGRSIEEHPFPDAPFPRAAQTRTWSLLLRFGL